MPPWPTRAQPLRASLAAREPKDRKRVLLRFAELIRADLERLAALETLDVGKPIAELAGDVDVPFAADCIAYYAEFADKLYDEVAPTGPNDLALVRREPLGVIAAIVPWNYPLIISAWKLGPALLAGNSVVLKPAEQSPLTAIRSRRTWPAKPACRRVCSMSCPGYGEEAGKPLALHDDVDMVSFTGSTEVGKLMLRYAGESNMKRVALECGGKSPHVVMADADIEAAAEGIAWGIYYNAGETCHAGSRVIVHERVKDALIEAIARRRRHHPARPSFRTGDPDGGADRPGPHAARARLYRQRPVAQGARVALGGKRALERLRRLLRRGHGSRRVSPDMRVAREEIFGPVLTVTTFTDEAEAIRLANDTHLWPGRRGLDFRHERLPPPVQRAAGRHSVGQHLRPLVPRHAVRRLQTIRLRP